MPPKKSASNASQSPKKARSTSRSRSRSRGRPKSPARGKKQDTIKSPESTVDTIKPKSSRSKSRSSTKKTDVDKSIERRSSARLNKEELTKPIDTSQDDVKKRRITKIESMEIKSERLTRSSSSRSKKVPMIKSKHYDTFINLLIGVGMLSIIGLFTYIIFVLYAGARLTVFQDIGEGGVKKYKFSIPSIKYDWKKYNSDALKYFAIYLLINIICYYIPFGEVYKVRILNERRQFRLNAIYGMLIQIALIGIAIYFKVDIVKPIKLIKHLQITALVFAILLAIIAFIASLKIHSNRGFLKDFIEGKAILPHCLGLDWKIFCFYRCSMNCCVILCLMHLFDNYTKNNSANNTLVAVVGMKVIYFLVFHGFEKSIFHSMSFNIEKFGFFTIYLSFFYIPFLGSYHSYFIKINNISSSNEILIASSLLFLIGLYITFASNKQKQLYRDDPYHPDVVHLKSITSSNGKRILTSGWWGFVRHPNYLGEIIVAIALCIPCGFNHPFVWYSAVSTIILLVFRALQDDAGCGSRHGSSWIEYRKTVKYHIIPYVF